MDLKKTDRLLYAAKTTPSIVDVPPRPFLMIDGVGDPSGEVYAHGVEALYTVAYGARFALKNAGTLEYTVPPLEGFWDANQEGKFELIADRSAWAWTMVIPQPPQVTQDLVDAARQRGAKKKPGIPVDRVRLSTYDEGRSIHVLHIGPYAAEAPAIKGMLEFAAERDLKVTGRHHEIYLSDPRRTEPAKLKTIIRYGVS
ncbi:MAG TPA: GyrI-like domain-containing protein [Stackebrandtia sp.]|uniref:GyrI-like domain-containing protein n=1 Tax=Stackebrandtia sp. TaxID=2023065 RepID=UPI002D6DA468|nr:GyrI-like domain-containing protein [Stackebrandtia sp.]HZE39029.1 GyrI-like domain-containing protein [Stackebrandtia sp.]